MVTAARTPLTNGPAIPAPPAGRARPLRDASPANGTWRESLVADAHGGRAPMSDEELALLFPDAPRKDNGSVNRSKLSNEQRARAGLPPRGPGGTAIGAPSPADAARRNAPSVASSSPAAACQSPRVRTGPPPPPSARSRATALAAVVAGLRRGQWFVWDRAGKVHRSLKKQADNWARTHNKPGLIVYRAADRELIVHWPEVRV